MPYGLTGFGFADHVTIIILLGGVRRLKSRGSLVQANEAGRRYEEAGEAAQEPPRFEARDLESVSGRYHTVCCIDVLIHYPQVSHGL
jgi:magnesium-protoporphyrin O-methyltransferase